MSGAHSGSAEPATGALASPIPVAETSTAAAGRRSAAAGHRWAGSSVDSRGAPSPVEVPRRMCFPFPRPRALVLLLLLLFLLVVLMLVAAMVAAVTDSAHCVRLIFAAQASMPLRAQTGFDAAADLTVRVADRQRTPQPPEQSHLLHPAGAAPRSDVNDCCSRKGRGPA